MTSRGRVFTATSRCDCEISCCLGPVGVREREREVTSRAHAHTPAWRSRPCQSYIPELCRGYSWVFLGLFCDCYSGGTHSRQFPSAAFALDNQGYCWCPRVCLRRSLPRTECARSIGDRNAQVLVCRVLVSKAVSSDVIVFADADPIEITILDVRCIYTMIFCIVSVIVNGKRKFRARLKN